MAQPHKYYHNDYKKLMGVDETRTASEKLLDKAIGGFKPAAEIKEDQRLQKKVKQQHSSITHSEALSKVMKSIESNNSASKLMKPLTILKKCLNDKTFTLNPQINNQSQWKEIVQKLVQIDQKIIGNYAEIILAYDCLWQIFSLLLPALRSLVKEYVKLQQQESQQKQTKKEQIINKGKDNNILGVCQMQILYCKLFTDDSFAFHKTLAQFKQKYFAFFSSLLSNQSSNYRQQSYFNYMEKMLLKLFKVPHQKFQWIKTSLTQFFKQFNISYKHLLNPDLLSQYLQLYNLLISQKGSKGTGEEVNIFGNGGRGGKITKVQVSSSDGFDKWASKQ